VGKSQRDKGKNYELEVAELLRTFGWSMAKRSGHRQAQIGDGSPDVDGLSGYFIECKRYASIGRVYKWLQQAIDTCQDGRVPVVFMRGDREESLVVIRATDFLEIVTKEWERE